MIWNPWKANRLLRLAISDERHMRRQSDTACHRQGERLRQLSERLRKIEVSESLKMATGVSNVSVQTLVRALPEYEHGGLTEHGASQAALRAFEELKQLRAKGLTAKQRKALELFRETGKAEHLEAIPGGIMASQNAQATEVKFRQVKDVNRGLRVAIRNIIINLAYAQTLPAGGNARGEIEISTLTQALTFTDLGDLGSAERLGKEALGRAPKSRGYEAHKLEVIEGGSSQ